MWNNLRSIGLNSLLKVSRIWLLNLSGSALSLCGDFLLSFIFYGCYEFPQLFITS